eukprot:CAMPEP_0117439028 /NCGR_PEP_ID=MMETSP0759-20121206/2358_1 /TAXON_ID=63605 /ORGANISM="Percolomonas cosmopolitus, Strain WS" /LENGTH=255 /DNA_ID=CAMNT_0005230739 /DNA_START=2588 /DNA_END=3355 /DNA_ORIENTATION=-
MTADDFQPYFKLTQVEAAKKLGVSLSTLKRRFYELKLGKRWPRLQEEQQEKDRYHPGDVEDASNSSTASSSPHRQEMNSVGSPNASTGGVGTRRVVTSGFHQGFHRDHIADSHPLYKSSVLRYSPPRSMSASPASLPSAQFFTSDSLRSAHRHVFTPHTVRDFSIFSPSSCTPEAVRASGTQRFTAMQPTANLSHHSSLQQYHYPTNSMDSSDSDEKMRIDFILNNDSKDAKYIDPGWAQHLAFENHRSVERMTE